MDKYSNPTQCLSFFKLFYDYNSIINLKKGLRMKYKPYQKDYKIKMLRYAKERIEACRRNIHRFELMLKMKDYDINTRLRFLIIINKERNLLKFLLAYGGKGF